MSLPNEAQMGWEKLTAGLRICQDAVAHAVLVIAQSDPAEEAKGPLVVHETACAQKSSWSP